VWIANIVSLGYHGAEDFNAGLPKSRLPTDYLFTDLLNSSRKYYLQCADDVAGVRGGEGGLPHDFAGPQGALRCISKTRTSPWVGVSLAPSAHPHA